MLSISRLVVALSLVFLSAPQVSEAAFAIPPNDGYVTDDAGILKPDEESAIEAELTEYKKTTSNEIAVLAVNTMSGADIAETSVEVLRKWGIGDAQKNNGILILIAYADKKIFIATGYGLEGAVPDLVAKGIIEEDITPAFRKGEYGDGIKAAVTSLEKHIAGEYTADRYSESLGPGLPAFLWVFVLIAIQVLAAWFSQSKSWWAGGIVGGVAGVFLTILYTWWLSIPILIILGLVFDYVVSKAGPRNRRGGRGGFGGFGGGSFGGGSSGSGGFGGFSGGSGGGGGAGGSW